MARLRLLKAKKGDVGQALPEYGLILAFMAIILWVVFQTFGGVISNFFTNFAGQLNMIAGG